MTTLIECIPNFSEARRPEVIDQIVAAIQSVNDVKLLDRSSDLDHNRTVLTFAGSPMGVEEAAFRAIKTASELIDLDAHTGEHPRIGATDVVPFVPLSGATMDDCVGIAKRLGQRVGRICRVVQHMRHRERGIGEQRGEHRRPVAPDRGHEQHDAGGEEAGAGKD